MATEADMVVDMAVDTEVDSLAVDTEVDTPAVATEELARAGPQAVVDSEEDMAVVTEDGRPEDWAVAILPVESARDGPQAAADSEADMAVDTQAVDTAVAGPAVEAARDGGKQYPCPESQL